MVAPLTYMNRIEIIEPELQLDRRIQPTNGNGSAEKLPEIKANILLVDDRADKLMAVEAVLSSLGQNIVKARSGKEALRHLLRQEFAVILLDVSMPCMDGFETSALSRNRSLYEHTPIIVITSMNKSANHNAKGYSLSAVDSMVQPTL